MVSVNVSEITDLAKDIGKLKIQISSMKEVIRKRIKRLKERDFENTPAYKQAMENGLLSISVRGKSYQELQSEFWKLKNFMDMKTSTIKGVNSYLDNIQQAVGVSITDKATLNNYLTVFFDMVDRLKEQLEASGKTAEAMDYRKIQNSVNEIVKQDYRDVNSLLDDVKGYQNGFNDAYDRLIQRAMDAIDDTF